MTPGTVATIAVTATTAMAHFDGKALWPPIFRLAVLIRFQPHAVLPPFAASFLTNYGAGNCTCSAWASNEALSALRMYPEATALSRLLVYSLM